MKIVHKSIMKIVHRNKIMSDKFLGDNDQDIYQLLPEIKHNNVELIAKPVSDSQIVGKIEWSTYLHGMMNEQEQF